MSCDPLLGGDAKDLRDFLGNTFATFQTCASRDDACRKDTDDNLDAVSYPSSLVGGGSPGSIDADRSLHACSANVTSLTSDRLTSVLDLAEVHGIDLIALQETRHPSDGYPWAASMAAKKGWRIQWSRGSSLDRRGKPTNGGCALLWRRTLGKSTEIKVNVASDAQHRTAARRFAFADVVVAYGNAKRADTEWFSALLEGGLGSSSHGAVRPRVVLGDFNWKVPYGKILPEEWCQA